MNKESELDKLFGEWRKNDESFCRDGVADWKLYEQSRPRLLYLLKEVNDPRGGMSDLITEVVRKGKYGPTFNNLTRWTRGIRNLPGDTPWVSQLIEISDDERRLQLASVGVMNIKKSPGGGSTPIGSIQEIARKDAGFLRRQLEIFEPDLTICCGTGTADAIEVVLGEERKPSWRHTSRGIRWFDLGRGGQVIDYFHPQAHIDARLLHYGIVDAVRELMRELN